MTNLSKLRQRSEQKLQSKKLSETGIDQIVVTEDNSDKTEVGLDMNRIIGEETSEET